MSQRLHTGRLILTPVDPYFAPTHLHEIVEKLYAIDLIGESLGADKGYLMGEAFMQLVTFMGCSPAIRLTPGETGEAFCHLTIEGPADHPKYLHGRNTRPPRCANCRKRLADWQTALEQMESSTSAWQAVCPHCGQHQDPATYDFRQTAGCGRFFIIIENIFPQEALPSPSLLARLAEVTKGAPWHFFFQQM